MAQILQSIDELELFFADLIMAMTGLNEKAVLIQYQPQGQPSSKIGEDVAYVKVTPEPDERGLYKNRKKVYNSDSETYTFLQQSSRTLTLHVVFYGPHCYELCTTMNEKFYFNDYQVQMRQNYLSIVPDRTNGPIRLPEQHNGQWWQRCDIELRFYNTVAIEETVSTFKEFDIRTEVN